MKFPKPRRWIPQNPNKWINPNKIVARSNLEEKWFNFLDSRKNVIAAASEEFFIPYTGPDGKRHRYYVDVWFKVKTKTGEEKEFIAEIKPQSQTKFPRKPGKVTKKSRRSYENRLMTYAVNKCKWDAAEKFAEKNGIEFVYMTETKILNKDLK